MAAPKRHVFTSESVTEGHPDKVADQISDAVLDAILARDPDGRVACETLVTTGMAVVAGEITTTTYVHIPDLVRETVESHRLHRRGLRVRRTDLRGAHLDRPAVARHRHGRGFGEGQGAGGRRPGHDVRLRHQRDPRADAAAHHAGPPDRRAAGRGAEGTARSPAHRVAAARRQVAGLGGVRGRPTGRGAHRGRVHPARRAARKPAARAGHHPRGRHRRGHQAGARRRTTSNTAAPSS